jgi:hypothetical protein
MHKLLIFASLLILCNCGRETKGQMYLPKMEFKRTKNPNYKNYFPQAEIPKQVGEKDSIYFTTEVSEPLPSFTPKSNKINHPEKEKSAGVFDFLFGKNGSKNEEYSNEAICEEILDINKIILVKQNRKLELLTDEKKRFIDQINSMEKKIKRQTNQRQEKQQTLETEIDRLNRLIKILSSEIK